MRIQRWLLPFMLCAVASPQCPGSFSAQHVIASDSLKVQSIALGDINGDGLLDLAAASYGDNSIEWFPNEMTDIGTFGQKNIVTTGATGAQYVVVGDIDGDHFLDLISASYLATTPIAWYRNTDGKGAFSSPNFITTDSQQVQSIQVGDVDGDGNLDVVSASYVDSKIAWYRNTDGKGTFGSNIVIATTASGAQSIAVGDVNNDGFIDVVSASRLDNKIAWYQNTDGKGNFGTENVVTTNAVGAYDVTIADVNGDGWVDIVSASFKDNTIAWYKSMDGKGAFSTENIVSSSVPKFGRIGVYSVVAEDLDGDGFLDLATASFGDNTIAWVRYCYV